MKRKRILLIVMMAAAIALLVSACGQSKAGGSTSALSEGTEETKEPELTEEELAQQAKEEAISQAEAQAVQYDYEGAIETLNTIEWDEESDPDIAELVSQYQSQQDSLVATTPENVTHIFFHTLVVDPTRGFSLTGSSGWDNSTKGFCQWMTTVDEFNAIMEQMYERGYVLVSIYDLVDITTDESGVEHVTAKNIMLPEGKKPFVLSLDDLSYYHSYDGRGCATKMIIGDDGKPTCEYIDADGNTLVGSYDCVPLLDDFLEEHPDFAYKGAKGTIALTGYNGILGYRTDYAYRDHENLTSDQEAWLEANPDFDWEQECADATAVANALKEDGWTFASHTWGHIRVGSRSLEDIQTDTQKWQERVAPLVGGTDIVIFAHGEDLAGWNEDYAASAKFQYMKSQGYTIFCNVDSSQYFVRVDDQYLRMGRRNLDGYRIWQAVWGGDDRLSDLIDSSSVIDALRPTDANLYSLN